MADVLSHIVIGHLAKRLSPWPGEPLLFALGSALPDLMGRAPGLAAAALDQGAGIELSPYLAYGIDALHTPLPMLLMCLLAAQAVPLPWRRPVFRNLGAGCFLHLAVDFLQGHITGGYKLAFPFSWVELELGWVGTEDSILALPVLIPLALVVERAYRRRLKQNEHTQESATR